MRCTKMTWVTSAGILLSACAQPGMDIEAERAALGEADADYSDAAETRDIDRWLSHYAADATLYPPNSGAITGMEEIREFGVEITGLPNFSASFDPVAVEVSVDGDMGYTLNNLMLTFTGPDGDPVSDQGPDFHVWRKQADGSWKIVRDIWNSSLPLEEPEDTSQADQQAINEVHDAEVAGFFSGDPEVVPSVFAESAVLMPPNEPIVEGTQAAVTWARNLYEGSSIQGDVEVTDFALSGDLAVERYAYDFEIVPDAGGDSIEDEGKGLHVYQRQPDGTWKITVDIWNSNRSAASAE